VASSTIKTGSRSLDFVKLKAVKKQWEACDLI